MRKRAIATIAITTLIGLVGCSTKKDEASSTTAAATTGATTAPTETSTSSTGSTPTESTYTPVVDDRAQGVTDDSIKIGIMYTDFTRVGPIIGYDQGDAEAAYNALIDEINANGGIHGRKIVPTFAAVDPSATDAPTAACTKLAEDEQVFIAVGFLFEDAGPCLFDTNETLVLGGGQTEALLAQAKVGWWTLEAGDDLLLTGIQTMLDQGQISQNLAVVATSGEEQTYETKIKPMLAAAGITPVSVAYTDPTFDVNQTYADSQTIAERFKSDGADQVLMLSVGGTFPGGIARTDWRPTLVFDFLASAQLYADGAGNDLSLLEGAIAAGAFNPENDYGTLASPTTECVENQTAAGLELTPRKDVPEGESIQVASSMIACRYVALLVAGLEKAGEELNYGTFTTAMNNLGDIMLPGYPDPWHFGPPPAADGDPHLYVYTWDQAKQEWVDSGA